MTLWPELEKFLSNVIGAVIGGSLVAWMGGYYSEKGKRKLMREEWPNLLAEANKKAYEEERGKRLATKEDIKNVVEQVQQVTKATETTKAEITGGLWERQWQFTQKRDVYARLIDALEMLEIKRSMLVRQSADETVQAEARRGGLEAIEEFRRARVLAELLLSPDAVDATHRIVRHVRDVFRESPRAAQAHAIARQAINEARTRIVEIGRAELGLSESYDPGQASTSSTSLEAP